MRYLVHNIYGNADDLIALKPDDVVAVPAGWDVGTEAARDGLFADLGIAGVSALPALLYQVAAQIADGHVTIPAHWAELRVADLPEPWTWAAIDAALP